MDKIDPARKPVTFNGPLEAGMRLVALLGAAYPSAFDLQRLVAFDYLLVHTGDIGGPSSLHPPVRLQSAQLLVRRQLVEQALLLMMTRELVEREINAEGILYSAGENAAPFLASLESPYLAALKERATWLASTFSKHTEQQFRGVMRRFVDQWVEEFQTAERSLGAEL
jgi:hypothetical protein